MRAHTRPRPNAPVCCRTMGCCRHCRHRRHVAARAVRAPAGLPWPRAAAARPAHAARSRPRRPPAAPPATHNTANGKQARDGVRAEAAGVPGGQALLSLRNSQGSKPSASVAAAAPRRLPGLTPRTCSSRCSQALVCWSLGGRGRTARRGCVAAGGINNTARRQVCVCQGALCSVCVLGRPPPRTNPLA